jgi:protein TonB
MFANLVESASHQKELKRRGRFLLATLAGYAMVVMCLGVVSIYAYDTHLENQNLEFITLVNPDLAEQPAPETRSAGPKSSTNPSEKNTNAQRTELIDRVDTSTKVPDTISSVAATVPPIPRSGGVEIGSMNTEGTFNGPSGIKNSDGGPDNGGNGSVVKIDTPPPPLKVTPTEQPKPTVIKSGGVMNGQATSLPKPVYSPMAKAAHANGPVSVQVLIDEKGKVISARATSGNPLLHAAAVQAAYQARFLPTTLSGIPVKVSGVITYNFVMQ